VTPSNFVLILVATIVVLAVLAKRFSLPYPIVFVVGGGFLAFFPHLPTIRLDPQWVFLIFLPPLLYSGGFFTDWTVFKQNVKPIGILAIGLVLITTVVVAFVAKTFLPGFDWADAFVLGAVISPPDPVAAGAVFERFSVPERIVAILDGEGLLNDAVALVLYGFAIDAVVTGRFSLAAASGDFVLVAVGGVLFGIAIAWMFSNLIRVLRRFDLSDTLIDVTIRLLTPYACYLGAEAIHVSGVLASVAAGIYVSRASARALEPGARLVSSAVWDLIVFLLNGFVFLLIGLQLRSIVSDPSFVKSELSVGLMICGVIIVVRMIWCYVGIYAPMALETKYGSREKPPKWQYTFILGWSGMRGIVSLAAALAIPTMTASGGAFPNRNVIIFVTFCVIAVTLVGQGLVLIPLISWLKIDAGGARRQRELEVRVAALEAAISRLRSLEPKFDSVEQWEVESRLIGEYQYRIGHLRGYLDGSVEEGDLRHDTALQHEALTAERREIARLRQLGDIPDVIFRTIQYDLDLAEERIS